MARPIHRREKPGGTYFVTTNTWERRALFHVAEWATVIEEKMFEYRDKGLYWVHHYVLMPDHLHVMLTPGTATTIEKAVQLIKGGSSREIGKQFGHCLPIWQPGFTEHLVRDCADYNSHVIYMDRNPVKAGLVGAPEAYRFCSVHGKFRLDPWQPASGVKTPSH